MARQKSADVPRRQKDEGPPRAVTIVIQGWLVTGRICDCRQEKTASVDAVFPAFPEPASGLRVPSPFTERRLSASPARRPRHRPYRLCAVMKCCGTRPTKK